MVDMNLFVLVVEGMFAVLEENMVSIVEEMEIVVVVDKSREAYFHKHFLSIQVGGVDFGVVDETMLSRELENYMFENIDYLNMMQKFIVKGLVIYLVLFATKTYFE